MTDSELEQEICWILRGHPETLTEAVEHDASCTGCEGYRMKSVEGEPSWMLAELSLLANIARKYSLLATAGAVNFP